MQKPRVYISSTYNDLKTFRQRFIEFLFREAHDDFELGKIMERMYNDGKGIPSLQTCLEEVEKCDIYILVVGLSMGSFPDEDPTLSYTQHEYNKAKCSKKLIHILFYDADESGIEDACKQFRKQVKPIATNTFSNIDQFEKEFIKIFYIHKPDRSTLRDESKIATINRNNQIQTFTISRFKNSQKIQYYIYTSLKTDYCHLFNFRISDIELQNHLYNFRTAPEILTEFIDSEDIDASDKQMPEKENKLTQMFINQIVENLLNEKGLNINNIRDFYSYLEEQQPLINSLVIPIKIEHSDETEDARLIKLNRQLKRFSIQENTAALKTKQIFFLINIQIKKDEMPQEKVRLLFEGLNPDGFDYNLGKLNSVREIDIERWISNKFESNPDVISGYITTYFPGDFPKPMSQVSLQAQNLIRNIK